MKNLLIASTSTLFGENYLEYLLPQLQIHFKEASTILFIPFARPSGILHDEYTNKVQIAFAKINKKVIGLHTFENKQQAIKTAQAIFVGGGNTFVLVSKLYQYDLINTLKIAIENGTPYLGCSAGSNIAGVSMQTTNDMPIAYPPSFDTLGILPFNINPHFLDINPTLKHNGETRETRIKEYHTYHKTPVLGLREGSWLDVKGNNIILKGKLSAKLFIQNNEPIEIKFDTNLNFC